jgi:Acyl-CoA carboxylase epsilon subunit
VSPMDADRPEFGADRAEFTVISGDASAEEVAAVVTALTAVCGAGRPATRRPRGLRAWADRSAMLRKPLHPGPEGWRASARPS